MLTDLAVTCSQCETPLGEGHRRLSMRTADGARHAYECDCGAVTITISK